MLVDASPAAADSPRVVGPDNLTETLRNARLDRNWSLQDVAVRLGVKRQQVGRWERSGAISVEWLHRYAALLGLVVRLEPEVTPPPSRKRRA